MRRQAIASGMPLARLRKMVAFERFLARLVAAQPDAWVLKGGLALQFRLMAHWEGIRSEKLSDALQAIFTARATHLLPQQMPHPPASWAKSFRRLSQQVGLEFSSLEEAAQAMHRFLDPVLGGQAAPRWNPLHRQWE
ncbi:MAG: hypothetical protein ACPL88_10195 [Bryobacteraceae bacterium]